MAKNTYHVEDIEKSKRDYGTTYVANIRLSSDNTLYRIQGDSRKDLVSKIRAWARKKNAIKGKKRANNPGSLKNWTKAKAVRIRNGKLEILR